MQIHLSPRHLTLTAAIHSYVAEKIEHLENIAPHEVLAAHVVLLHDETKKKKHICKVHLAVPGPDIYAEDAEDDLYAAIDKVVDKLARQLRKRKTRRVKAKVHKIQQQRERSKGKSHR